MKKQFFNAAAIAISFLLFSACNNIERHVSDEILEVKLGEYVYQSFTLNENRKKSFNLLVDFTHVSGPSADILLLEKDEFNLLEDGKFVETDYKDKLDVRESFKEEIYLGKPYHDEQYYIVIKHHRSSFIADNIRFKISYEVVEDED
ncbi:MAG: hypothetical protein KDC90_06935 [Ignavibacteriae bacterium]|nr:hypothetical protein [Ignavibacteriota bacterium]